MQEVIKPKEARLQTLQSGGTYKRDILATLEALLAARPHGFSGYVPHAHTDEISGGEPSLERARIATRGYFTSVVL